MSQKPSSPTPPMQDDRRELAYAIAHEVANHLGGIRLQAHLIDEDLDALGLASASIEIDATAGRAAPLLALLRPILSGKSVPGRPMAWVGLLAGLRRQLDDEGTRGIRVEIEPPADPTCSSSEMDGLFSLIRALVDASLEWLTPREAIRIWVEAREGETVLLLEDDGKHEDLSEGSPLRGRPLVVRRPLREPRRWPPLRRTSSAGPPARAAATGAWAPATTRPCCETA